MNEIEELKLIQYNILSLASVGDAVHTLFVRERMFLKDLTPNKLHSLSSKFCNAKHQCLIFEKLFPLLNEKEKEIALRARNHRGHSPKNSSLEQYKKATAFESVVGYLYLTKQEKRLKEILEISMEEE